MRRLTFALLFALSMAASAQAELKGTFSIPGQDAMTIFFKDENHIRLDSPEQGFLLVSGDKVYTVVNQGGMRVAIDMARMGQMIKEFQEQAPKQNDKMPEPTITATDRRETVAGYEGVVHRITIEGATSEVVLTDDKDVVALTRGFLNAINRLGQSVSPDMDLDISDMLNTIDATGYPGILRQEQGFELKSVEPVNKGADFYRLPDDVQVMGL
ncbi:MAG: hypothetical protein R3296_05790 [Oleiphilaceae bacterium]|nr:hypothetical protein [Oleiphilaceae bacterium]